MYPVAGQNKPIMVRCWHVSTRTEEHDTGPMMAFFYSPLGQKKTIVSDLRARHFKTSASMFFFN